MLSVNSKIMQWNLVLTRDLLKIFVRNLGVKKEKKICMVVHKKPPMNLYICTNLLEF